MGVDRAEVGLAVVVMVGDVDPIVVPPDIAPETPVPLVPVEGKIELPSVLVVVLPIAPLEFNVEVPDSVLPLRDVFRLVPESDVGELMLVDGTVDVTGGLVEVVLDNTPGVVTQGRGSMVWFIGFVVGAIGFVVGAVGFV
jgi:hypothetical protein